MAYWVVNGSDKRKTDRTPFEIYWGESSPLNTLGNDGDVFVLYGGTDPELFLKKVSGAWVSTSGGFSGWDNTNSELFTLNANASSIVLNNFTILLTTNLRVEKDGITMYEGHGFTRNISTNSIDFDSAILAEVGAEGIVFVGKYN